MARNLDPTMEDMRREQALLRSAWAKQKEKPLSAITVALAGQEAQKPIPYTMEGIRQLGEIASDMGLKPAQIQKEGNVPSLIIRGLRPTVQWMAPNVIIAEPKFAKISEMGTQSSHSKRKMTDFLDDAKHSNSNSTESNQNKGNVRNPVIQNDSATTVQERLGDARLKESERRINELTDREITKESERRINELADREITHVEIDGSFYVEDDKGYVEINGKKYFPANSNEKLSPKTRYTEIDYDFEKKFIIMLKDALPESRLILKALSQLDIGRIVYALVESYKGDMDQKHNLEEDTLYLFDGMLYNRNEAGNIIWGAAMAALNFSLEQTKKYADLGTYLISKRSDEDNNTRAIVQGWKYYHRMK